MKPEDITASWSAFVRETLGDRDLTNFHVAERMRDGTSDTTVGNWINGKNFGQPAADKVIAFARAFGKPLPVALVAAGYGDESEYRETVAVARDVSEMTIDETLDSIIMMCARIREVADAPEMNSPAAQPRKRRRKFSPRRDVEPL